MNPIREAMTEGKVSIVRIACGAQVGESASAMWKLAAATGNRVMADFNGVPLVADFPAAVVATLAAWEQGMALAAKRETPLDRHIREAREAVDAWEIALRNCRDGHATPEDVKRYAIAVSEVLNEFRDVMPYSENC